MPHYIGPAPPHIAAALCLLANLSLLSCVGRHFLAHSEVLHLPFKPLLQGRYREGTGKVRGRYGEGTGKAAHSEVLHLPFKPLLQPCLDQLRARYGCARAGERSGCARSQATPEECRYGRLLYVSAVRHVRDVSCGELAHLSLLPLGVAFDLTRRRIVRVKYEVIVSHKVVVARQRRKAVLRTRSRVLGCAFKVQHSPLARLRGVISVITPGSYSFCMDSSGLEPIAYILL